MALLLVIATYPDYPKPAEAQHPEWLVKLVQEAFEAMGFVVKGKEKFLTTLYRDIRLPTGEEILNFHGGKETVLAMVKGWLSAATGKELKENSTFSSSSSLPPPRCNWERIERDRKPFLCVTSLLFAPGSNRGNRGCGR